MRIRTLFLGILVCALSASAAGAWNRPGHELVARIAWNRLDTGERARLVEILRGHPAFPLWEREAEAQHPADFDFFIVGRAAVWPDDIKGRGPENPYRVDDADVHADWHYVDRGLSFDGTPVRATPSPNVLTALKMCDARLRARDTSPADRAIAMSWLLHLLGDIHQPLHCAERFSRDLPQGDMGGNKWMVRLPDGTEKNLHALWDGLLASDSTQVGGLAETLPATVRELPKASELASKWIDESFADARGVAYADGRVPGAAAPERAVAVKVPHGLPAAYLAVASRTARARAVVAGFRLASRLRRYLADH